MFCGSGKRRFFANYNLRASHLLFRLRRVPAVSEERAAPFSHQQRSRTPGESTEVPDVGKMRNQEGVQARFLQGLAHSLLTAREIHRKGSVSGETMASNFLQAGTAH
jgi:hypothetical protein